MRSHCKGTDDGYAVPGMPRNTAAVALGWQTGQCLVLAAEGATPEQQLPMLGSVSCTS